MPLSTLQHTRIILMTILLIKLSISGDTNYFAAAAPFNFQESRPESIEPAPRENQADTQSHESLPPDLQIDHLSKKEPSSDVESERNEEIAQLFIEEDPPVPSPTNVQLAFINISSVLITWSYDHTPNHTHFIVQSSHDGDPYKNVSGLLNSTAFVYSEMKYSAYYQFRVISYLGCVASSPAETKYFVNGVTAPPGPPVNIMAIVMSYSVINLQWDAPNTPSPLIYLIVWGNNKTSLDMEKVVAQSTHVSFSNLEPGEMYYFRLRADINSWMSVPSDMVNATTLPPNLPPIILYGNSSVTWLYLTWTAPPDSRYPLKITNFHVYYEKLKTSHNKDVDIKNFTNAENFKHFSVVNETEHSLNLTSLDPGAIYVVCIGYTSGKYQSDLSEPLLLETHEDVTCGSCDPLSSTELKIIWKVTTSLNKTRTVAVYEHQDDTGADNILSETKTNLTNGEIVISDLHPWTGHAFAVVLETTSGEPSSSGLCPILTCWTYETAPSKPPTEIRLTQISSRSVTLEWSQPPLNAQNGLITDYTIVYQCNLRDPSQVCYTKQIDVTADRHSNLSFTIEHLIPFTTYSFVIAANTQAGRGPFSFQMTALTLEEAPSLPPTNLTVYNVTEDSFFIAWSPPLLDHQNGIIVGYSISVFEIEQVKHIVSAVSNIQRELLEHQGTDRYAEILNGTRTEKLVQGLSPLTSYMVEISARTHAGNGPYSNPVNVSTLQSVQELLLSINFTVVVRETTSHANNKHCFSLEFNWEPIITANLTLPLLNTNNVIALKWRNVIYYRSESTGKTCNVSLGENLLSSHVTIAQSNETLLMIGQNYSVWLEVDVALTNGTRLILQSLPFVVSLPSCQDPMSYSSVQWRIVLVACIGALVIGVIVLVLAGCLGHCLYKWTKNRGRSTQSSLRMDNFVPPEIEENDYLLDPSLRISDGRSSVSSSTENESTRISSSSESLETGSDTSPLSVHNSDSDSDLLNLSDDVPHPLPTVPPTLAVSVTSPTLGMSEQSLWPSNGTGYVRNADSPMTECQPHCVHPLAPRQNPDGCSLSSSTSSDSIPLLDNERC